MSVLSLGLFGLVGATSAQVFNNNYYFPDPYYDITTVKATELVNEDEIITVGFAPEPNFNGKSDIVLVKTKSSNGNVIWAFRYGLENLDERGYGLTVSYDEKHVIVAGTAERQPEINETVPDWDALVMKIEISTGNVIWSARYGTYGNYQDLKMVERSNVNTTNRPTYMLVGSSSLPNLKSVLYAISIFDNGALQWSNIYLEASIIEPRINDFAYTMVQNHEQNFIVTGTRYEDFEPSKIFTIGINPVNGALSDKYIDYSIEGRDHYEGAICNIDLDGDIYYGLAFTTRKPDVENGVDEAISVAVLDKYREPVRAYLYWQEGHQYNNGLSIYQSTESPKWLDVYTNTFRSTYNPGFLNIEISGTVNYFLKYNASQFENNKYATAMEQTKYGYTAKALHNDGQYGFMLAGLKPTGKTECAEEQKMNQTDREIKFKYRPYDPYTFGEVAKREIKVNEVHGKKLTCDGMDGQVFKNNGATDDLSPLENSAFRVYPNPLNAHQGELKLDYNLGETQRVEITVYNALGQQTYYQAHTLVSGSNQLSLETNVLSSGVNLITVRSGGNLLYQEKVIMD